jgi:hypothetical protein
MQNMRVAPGVVRSRPGTTPIAPATGFVTGLFNWIDPLGVNHVLFRDGTVISDFVQGVGTATVMNSIGTTYRPSFADLDVWTYICGYDTAGIGTFQARTFDGTNAPDLCFAPPIALTAATATDGGSGQCTQGTHFIGFVYENRDGYSGRPSTKVSGSPISITLNAGLRKVNITVTIPALTDGGPSPTGGNATLFLIVTRADNPNIWYFLPPAVGASTSVEQRPVPYNMPTMLNFVFDLSDEDLAASADSANDQFNLLSQADDGTGPFNPNFVVAYGQRMCYGVGTVIYISDIDNPQQIAADRNQLSMPNKRYIGMAFPLPGGTDLFLTGDGWTARVTDNSDIPATWAQPIKVSDRLGAPFPNCVCFKTGGGNAWIATSDGPYQFNGQFAEKPLSYLVSDQWERVNWTAAYAIEIADDAAHRKLYMAVPLDGATIPTHTFLWDYQNGLEFDQVDFSIDNYNFTQFSSIGVVKEISNDKTNLWIAPPGSGHPPYCFTVQITDSSAQTASANCCISVSCPGA